ncbi:MAG TPA: hypothetical protein QGG59_05255 [Planctomycetota bacterium]|nr:hypothetical protein [Planctomycetota bacterium]MDP7245440.1 hypothetical protein [Planctomycetota bacterium]HJM39504.1 hypothetical protein [Planctomycetota bacterium]
MPSKLSLLAAVGLCIGLTAAPLSAQKEDEVLTKGATGNDPYTEGKPELKEALGIASYGPFLFCEHGNDKVQQEMGDLDILWIETEHFRIGSNLPEYKIPNGDKIQKNKLRAELKELNEVLPGFKYKRIKVIDKWLRLHLYAQRVEKIWDDVSEILGVDDSAFPAGRGELVNGAYAGEGPYFGHAEKHCILLLQKESNLGRFTQRFINLNRSTPIRWQFTKTDTIFFGTCTEFGEGYFRNDSILHNHVVFNVAHNLVDAFKHHTWSLPVWIPEGIAHHLCRKQDERYNNYSAVEEGSTSLRKEWDWAPKVRARVKHEIAPPSETMANWMKYDDLKFTNHLMVWARVDYMLKEHPEKFASFVSKLKSGIPGVESYQLPTADQVRSQQKAVFMEMFGWTWEDFDEAWSKWILKNYPKK